ncbi:hypothetical protein IW261DRAFT_1148713 [Armillaria novae-zelandiae]|uniref:Uncharacterized protein n=1 Tax=Armillaria novae-zelandiae TaxID=153914 RepID=A0AA39PB00_9AGAR|nr:hypothetical protein IW261DRAFT_1148713 [Armillaria novae-zelandiae]
MPVHYTISQGHRMVLLLFAPPSWVSLLESRSQHYQPYLRGSLSLTILRTTVRHSRGKFQLSTNAQVETQFTDIIFFMISCVENLTSTLRAVRCIQIKDKVPGGTPLACLTIQTLPAASWPPRTIGHIGVRLGSRP